MQPGTALTSRFMFGTASILVGPPLAQKALTPASHSLGLVKNVKVDAAPTKVDLTQGISNDVVATVTNGFPITISGEIYEYTAKNLAYGLGLDGGGLVTQADGVAIGAPVASAATSVTVASAGAFQVGDWIYLQENQDDQIHVAQLSAVAGTSLTFAGYPVPTGMSFSTNGRVGELTKTDADPVKANTNVSVRILGLSQKDKSPIILHFPKCRITKGFSMAFSSDNFGNMPFEFTPMTPLPDDPGYDANFRQRMSVLSA
jgi:hypothetical protein